MWLGVGLVKDGEVLVLVVVFGLFFLDFFDNELCFIVFVLGLVIGDFFFGVVFGLEVFVFMF